MPNFTAKITDDSKITVGQNEGNHFSIEITPAAGELKDVIVRVSIPCGPKKPEQGTFLVDDAQGPRPNVNYLLPANADKSVKIDPLIEGGQPAPPPGYLAWEMPSKGIVIGAGTTMKIDVTGLAGNIPSGIANVIVGIRDRGPVKDKPFTAQTLPVEAKLKEGDEKGVKVHYFTASKDYVLHASEEEVILSWHTTSAVKTVSVFKNNVKIWPPYGGSEDLFVLDRPGITSVYRLEAMGDITASPDADREKLLTDGTLVVRTLTVQVAQAGWNRQPLQQGYPTALMSTLSFKSGESERLYGVFVDAETNKVGLYSSATGFPPWRMESGGKNFSEIKVVSNNQEYFLSEMSHSPGIGSGGKLWLIGGSSVEPTQISNEVWYYHKNDTTKVEEWVRDKPGGFSARMGHCVVNFQNKLWVLGGYSDATGPLNDVWSYDQSNQTWSKQTTGTIWPARCMFAAAATPASPGVFGFEKEKLWIYGGAEDPDNIVAKMDLWSTTDGATWKEEKTLAIGPLRGQPNGATLFWDDGLHLGGSFKSGSKTNPADLNGATLAEMVYSLSVRRYLWEANPVSWGWEQFGGNTFLMQSIVFNRFWFFWSLFQNIKTAPKLNIFIPS
ncbi:MAG: kelch repeat-containing protein [Pyrinomonadaceae bacterium]